MKLTSPAFEHEGSIPAQYTCDGADISPELVIEGVPEKAKSLVLIVDDPDAPGSTFVHWVAYNIDPTTSVIPKGEMAGIQGKNDFGKTGYGGPCPPSGTHRYFFKLYALGEGLDLGEGATKPELEAAMKNPLATAELIGTYSRQ